MYRVDTTVGLLRTAAGIYLHDCPWDITLVVVGIGGTGGYLAEYAAQRAYAARHRYRHHDRAAWAARVVLVDPDTVERRNVARQNFGLGEVGQPKVAALATRLLQRYAGQGLCVSANQARFRKAHLGAVLRERSAQTWVLGCVDNAPARRAIAAACTQAVSNAHQANPVKLFWLDCGNDYATGQVLLGNAASPAQLAGAFDQRRETVRALPLPTWYEPGLLAAGSRGTDSAAAERRGLDCATALELGYQDPGINGMVAQVAANLLSQGLHGTLTLMGARVDLDTCEVSGTWIEPRDIAARCGLAEAALFA